METRQDSSGAVALGVIFLLLILFAKGGRIGGPFFATPPVPTDGGFSILGGTSGQGCT